MPKLLQIRQLETGDIDAVLAIQTACYPAHLIESAEALLAKSRLSPSSCWLAYENDRPLGYLFSHPWQGKIPPALDFPLACLPDQADCFFLHDLAIHPVARGCGAADKLLRHAMQWARAQRFSWTMLVAVQGSQSFWQRYGFSALAAAAPALQEKLAGYEPGAACLTACMT